MGFNYKPFYFGKTNAIIKSIEIRILKVDNRFFLKKFTKTQNHDSLKVV